MIESLIRELIRQQDTLAHFLPNELWYKYAQINEDVIDYLNQELT